MFTLKTHPAHHLQLEKSRSSIGNTNKTFFLGGQIKSYVGSKKYSLEVKKEH